MKTLFILFLLVIGTSISSQASSAYHLNESAIETAFDHSEDVTYLITDFIHQNTLGPLVPGMPLSMAEKSQTTAAIIAFAAVILPSFIYGVVTGVTGIGGLICLPLLIVPFLPIHRWYLGTGGNGAKIGALYCVTLSWCGWLSIIDGIVLLMDESGTAYIDNPKYIMWSNKGKE